jgi:hypothetical protein
MCKFYRHVSRTLPIRARESKEGADLVASQWELRVQSELNSHFWELLNQIFTLKMEASCFSKT